MTPLTFAAIGCGSRVSTYAKLICSLPQKSKIVACADPKPERLEMMRKITGDSSMLTFPGADELLAQGKLADVMIIGTQDAFHAEPCIKAMELGYDVLMEKPIATNFPEVLRLEQEAKRLGRRVLICHVLRYTPFYGKIKSLLEAGAIGEITSINAIEGVGPFHQAHSYVRGHWSVVGQSSPMIISKSCHDMDIISWLVDSKCEQVASFGSLSYFNSDHAPAGAPARCTDGCPVAADCPYDAHRYLTDERKWLNMVFKGGIDAPDDDVLEWLRTSPWGRCVYHCDNDTVDRQTVNMSFANNVTATFTMTAFDVGRSLEVRGTKGILSAGSVTKRITEHDIVVTDHFTGANTHYDLTPDSGEYVGHGGGDQGLIEALHNEWAKPDSATMRSSIQRSVESHAMGFAAEQARATKQVVSLDEFIEENRRSL